ncbi:MAG: protein kinase [Planctomycetota bacterium]
MRRFEREAKTLASLNHPNVAQIFGVDQVESTYFLVLELVPGESLEERLRRGPLPIVVRKILGSPRPPDRASTARTGTPTRTARHRLSRRPLAPPSTLLARDPRAGQQARSYPPRPHHCPSARRTARQPATAVRSVLWWTN